MKDVPPCTYNNQSNKTICITQFKYEDFITVHALSKKKKHCNKRAFCNKPRVNAGFKCTLKLPVQCLLPDLKPALSCKNKASGVQHQMQ